MKTSTDWPFNCVEFSNLRCVVTKSLGYVISCAVFTSVSLYIVMPRFSCPIAINRKQRSERGSL